MATITINVGKDTKKTFKVGERLHPDKFTYIPNIDLCPNCHGFNFRLIKQPPSIACIRCHRIIEFRHVAYPQKAETDTKNTPPKATAKKSAKKKKN